MRGKFWLYPIGWILVVVAAVLYVWMSVFMWRMYISPSWDLGIFTQLARQYSELDAPIVNIKGPDYNLLGDHFHPILIALAPFYRLWPSGLTLLVIQALLFAISVYPLTALARERFGHAVAVLIGSSYVLSWGLINAVWAQFHEIAFAVPLIAFGLVQYLRGHYRSASVLIALLVFVKEDMGLTVAAFGVALLWQAWGHFSPDDGAFPRRRLSTLRDIQLSHPDAKHGLFHVMWGLFWFVFSIVVFLPLMNPEGQWDYTGRLATESEPQNILEWIVSVVGPGEKIITVGLLIAAAGIVGLRSALMVMLLPTLAWRFLGNVEFYWGWDFHYSAILIPVCAAAFIDGATRLRSDGIGGKKVHEDIAKAAVPFGAVTAMIVSFLMLSQTPLPLDEEAWRRTTHPEQAARAIEVAEERAAALRDEGLRPDGREGGQVASDFLVLAYLVPTTDAWWYGSMQDVTPDIIVLNSQAFVGQHPDAEAWAEDRWGGDWQMHYRGGPWEVAEKVG